MTRDLRNIANSISGEPIEEVLASFHQHHVASQSFFVGQDWNQGPPKSSQGYHTDGKGRALHLAQLGKHAIRFFEDNSRYKIYPPIFS